jgi:hypothetical protein
VDPATTWQPAPAFQRAEVPGAGVISMATLDDLRDVLRTEEAQARHLALQAAELDGHMEDRLADAGALLVPRRALWKVPPSLLGRIVLADQLVRLIPALDRWAAAPAASGGQERAGGWWRRGARRLRPRAGGLLRRQLVAVARSGAAAGAGVPDVGPLLESANELQARAEGLHAAAASVATGLDALVREIAQREEAERHLGFDSLHLAAYFHLYGLPPIEDPVGLEADEVAHLATGATLARPLRATPGAGADTSHRVPVAYTGVRHWVGSVRGRAAPVAATDPGSAGTLVISNRRLLFAGSRDSLSVPLTSLIDVDVFTNGIAVFSLGRPGKDLLLLTSPRQVTFYLNWAIAYAM